MNPSLKTILLSPFTPARVFRGAPGIWYESNLTSGYQDSAGTTALAVDSPVGMRVDKSGNGLHALQATGLNKPTLKNPPYSDLYDGTNSGMSTATFSAGTLSSNMDCFIAMKKTGTTVCLLASQGTSGTTWFGAIDNGIGTSASDASLAAGTPIYLVNGVAVPGGTATTRGQLYTAIGTGSWVIVEVQNLNLSTWTAFKLSQYTGALWNANFGGLVLCQAQPETRRTQIRRYLGAKVGIVL